MTTDPSIASTSADPAVDDPQPTGQAEDQCGAAYGATMVAQDEVGDRLPDDLQPSEFVGEYEFPDNSRRRIQGVIYLVFAVGCAVIAAAGASNPVANRGWWVASIGLGLIGVFAIVAGTRMRFDEQAALVRAQQAVGFPVGYASAQQVWHGVLSRPTWRVLVYSAEEVPTRRGLVTIDAVDGAALEKMVQPVDPDEWSDVGV